MIHTIFNKNCERFVECGKCKCSTNDSHVVTGTRVLCLRCASFEEAAKEKNMKIEELIKELQIAVDNGNGNKTAFIESKEGHLSQVRKVEGQKNGITIVSARK